MDVSTALELMRKPFPPRLIGKLPKGTKAQNECPASEKINCKICGGWHHPRIVHLDYVGHAALTDRLLDADPEWSWEPLAVDCDGLPKMDSEGGLWIKLTVRGVSRLGYGNAAPSSYKDAGSRVKEVIGDALRNAAMRFGAALELWHKGDLHEGQAELPNSDSPATDKPTEKRWLEPENSKAWANAKAAFVRDGNLNAVKERFNISQENEILIKKDCFEEGG